MGAQDSSSQEHRGEVRLQTGAENLTSSLPDDGFLQDARKDAAAFAEGKPLRDSDMIFFGAEVASDLAV